MDKIKKFVHNPRLPGDRQMDNAGYRETESSTKTKEVRIALQNRDTGPEAGNSQSGNNSATRICKPEVCRRARQRYQQVQTSESPWHRQKTFILLGTVVLFVIWLIVYITCSELGLV